MIFYLKEKGILAVGTIRANRLGDCSIMANKDLAKQDRGAMDYRVDGNSGIIVVKWVDNSIVQLVSNYVGINPMSTINRWCKKEKASRDIPCPQVVKQYNKSMAGVDLAHMLIAIYRIPCKTKRWYVKIFWHLVDISKVKAWILYRRQSQQHQEKVDTARKSKTLLEFTEGIINADKVNSSSARGRKQRSIDPVPRGKKPTNPLPVHDVHYDQVGHWPEPVSQRNRCRVCEMTCRMTCSKCRIYLCLMEGRNCYREFHNN